jgi:hypothetical protein
LIGRRGGERNGDRVNGNGNGRGRERGREMLPEVGGYIMEHGIPNTERLAKVGRLIFRFSKFWFNLLNRKPQSLTNPQLRKPRKFPRNPKKKSNPRETST